MLRNTFLKNLRDQRKSFMWWSIGIGALLILTILFYPSVADSPEFNELFEKLPEVLAKIFMGEVTDLNST